MANVNKHSLPNKLVAELKKHSYNNNLNEVPFKQFVEILNLVGYEVRKHPVSTEDDESYDFDKSSLVKLTKNIYTQMQINSSGLQSLADGWCIYLSSGSYFLWEKGTWVNEPQ